MGIFYDQPNTGLPLRAIAAKILGTDMSGDFSAAQICDDGEGVLNRYNVYQIRTGGNTYVLKKSAPAERDLYAHFLSGRNFSVPDYYGCTEHEGTLWILLEYLEGPDLRDFTPEMAGACAAAITPIMNAYWLEEPQFRDKPGRRFARYWARIQKRSTCLVGEPELQRAYAKFLNRQLTCPRTLCNGDFLQYNGIFREGKVYIIDWAFGGRMPYALDIARLIAHGSENRAAFPFYMTENHRQRYIQQVYQGLARKPDWE